MKSMITGLKRKEMIKDKLITKQKKLISLIGRKYMFQDLRDEIASLEAELVKEQSNTIRKAIRNIEDKRGNIRELTTVEIVLELEKELSIYMVKEQKPEGVTAEEINLRDELIKFADYTFKNALQTNYSQGGLTLYVDEYLNQKEK
jgi:hypothetical protein